MNENLIKLKNYFESILGIDDLKIVVGKISDNMEIDDTMTKYDIEDFFNRKKLYFNSDTNTLTTFCPCNGSSLKLHQEISTLECDDSFKWIILFKVYDEDFLKSNVVTPVRKVSFNESVIIDEPNKEKVRAFIQQFANAFRNGDGTLIATVEAIAGL